MKVTRLNGLKMFDDLPERPVIFIVGPTASGKTDLSIKLADLLDTEIISADSRYFYKGMDIGTDKPSPEELKRIKHHMIDIANLDETVSVAQFKDRAAQIISELHHQKKIPVVVGGTGLYVHALLKNWSMPELEADQQLRDELEKYADLYGKKRLYDFLSKVDPVSAEAIDYQNVRRTIRAVEVILKTGKTFSSQRNKNELIYSTKMIGILWDRNTLYERIDKRIDAMIAGGLVDEVKRIKQEGFSKNLPAMSAIGYREIADYLDGTITLDEAIMMMRRNSRTFVRRQSNWFKVDDPTIRWFDGRNLDITEVWQYLRSEYGWTLPRSKQTHI